MAPGLDLLGIGKKKSNTWSEKIKTGDRGIRNNDFLVSDLMDTLPPHPDQPQTRPVTASTSSSGHSARGKGSPFSSLPVSDDPDPFAAGASRRASPRQPPPRLPSQNAASRRNSESTTIKPAAQTSSRHSHQPGQESTSTVSSSTSNEFSPNSSRDWEQDTPTNSNPGLNGVSKASSNPAQQTQPAHSHNLNQRQSIARVPPPPVKGRPVSSGSNMRPTSSHHQSSRQNSRQKVLDSSPVITQIGNGEKRYSTGIQKIVGEQKSSGQSPTLNKNAPHQLPQQVTTRDGLPHLQTNLQSDSSFARTSPHSPQEGFPSELLQIDSGRSLKKDTQTPSLNEASVYSNGALLMPPGSSSSRRTSQRVQPPPRPSSDELAASNTLPITMTPNAPAFTAPSHTLNPPLTESQAIRKQYMEATRQQNLPPISNFTPSRRPPEPPKVLKSPILEQESVYRLDQRPMSAGAGTERSRSPRSPDTKPKNTFRPPPPSSSRDKNPKAGATAPKSAVSAPRSPTTKPAAPKSISSQNRRRHTSAESFMSPPLNQYGDPIIPSRRELAPEPQPEPVKRPTSPFKRPTSPFKRPTSPVQWVQKAFRRNSQPLMDTKRMSTAPGTLGTIHERRALTPEPRPLGLIRSRSPPPTAKSAPDIGRGEKKNKRLSAAALFATVFGFKGRQRRRRQKTQDLEISGPVGAPVRPMGEGAGAGPLPVGRLDQIRPMAGGDIVRALESAREVSHSNQATLRTIPETYLTIEDTDDDPTMVPSHKAAGMSMAEFLSEGKSPNPKTFVQMPTAVPATIPMLETLASTQIEQPRGTQPRPAPLPPVVTVQRESTVESLLSNDARLKRSGMVFSDQVVMPVGRSRSNSNATQTTSKTSASSGRPHSNTTFGIPSAGIPPPFMPPIPPPRASSLHSPDSDADSIASGVRSRSGSIKSGKTKLEMPPVPSPGLPPDAQKLLQGSPTANAENSLVDKDTAPNADSSKAAEVRPDTMVSVSTDNDEFQDALDDSIPVVTSAPDFLKPEKEMPSLQDLPGLRKPNEDLRPSTAATTDRSELSTSHDNSIKNASISTLASFDVSAFPRASQLPVPDNLTDDQRDRLIKAGVGLPGLEKAPTQNGLLTTTTNNQNRKRDDHGNPPSPKVFPPRESRQEGEFVFPDRDGEREFLFSDEELSEKAKKLVDSPTPEISQSKRASWMPSWANDDSGPVSPKPLRPTSSVFSMLTRPLSMWNPPMEEKKDEPPASPVSSGRATTPRSSVSSQIDRGDRFSDTSVASNTVVSGESVSSLPEKKEPVPQTQKLLSRIDELEAKIRELTAAKETQVEEQKMEKVEKREMADKSQPLASQAMPPPSTVLVQGKRMDVGELKREYEFLINQMDFLHRTIAGPGGVGSGQFSPSSADSNTSASARSSGINGFESPELSSKTLSARSVSPFGRRPYSPAMSDGRPASPTGSMSSATSSNYGRRISQRMSLRRPASPAGLSSQLEMDQMKKTVSRIEGLFDALDMLHKERVAEIEADSDDEKEYMKELAERKEHPGDEYSDDEFEELTESELEQARQEREQQRKRLQEFGSWLETTKDNCRNLQNVLGNAMDDGPGLFMPSAVSTNEGNMLSMMSLAAKLGNMSPPNRMSTSSSARNSGNYSTRNSLLPASNTDSTTLSKRKIGFGRPGSRTSMNIPRGDIPARRESLLYGTYRRSPALDAVTEEKKAEPELKVIEEEHVMKEKALMSAESQKDTAFSENSRIASDDTRHGAAVESFTLVAVVALAIAAVRLLEYFATFSVPAAMGQMGISLISGISVLVLTAIGKILGAPHLAERIISVGSYLPVEHRPEWIATLVLVAWGWARVARGVRYGAAGRSAVAA